MTWVIGASSLHGYGVLMSDVQVTFPDGTTADLAQKAFPVGSFIACGFAGSVRIGYAMIERLRLRLARPTIWDPTYVAKQFADEARELFEAAPAQERALGCSLLMVGASPTEAASFGARIYVTRLASPDFKPRISGRPVQVRSIGSGASVRSYKQSVRQLMRPTSGIMQGEIGRRGGWGEALSMAIILAVRRNPTPGISAGQHLVLIHRGEITSEYVEMVPVSEDVEAPDDRAPELASNYAEFCALCCKRNRESARASC